MGTVTNIQTVLRLSPVFARIVEQGNEENVFNAERPLAALQFLLDGGLFDFSDEELLERRLVTQEIVEKALGASRGAFDFMNEQLIKREPTDQT